MRYVASLKRYRYPVRVDGRDGWMCGIGAVLTAPEHRGRGHAVAPDRAKCSSGRAPRARCWPACSRRSATAFYERLGFSTVPLDEVTVQRRRARTDRRRCWCAPATIATCAAICGAARDTRRPAARLRAAARRAAHSLRARQEAAVRRAQRAAARGSSSSSWPRKGHAPSPTWCLSQNQYGWTLEEAGDRDPAGARLGGMLQVLLAREPSHRDPVIRAWWPRAFPVPPQLTLSRPQRPQGRLHGAPARRRHRRAAGPGRRVLLAERLLLS